MLQELSRKISLILCMLYGRLVENCISPFTNVLNIFYNAIILMLIQARFVVLHKKPRNNRQIVNMGAIYCQKYETQFEMKHLQSCFIKQPVY